MAEYLKNVALIGASGNLGSKTLKSLVKQNRHNITVITRPSSLSDYPSNIKVEKGDYKDEDFLKSALKGQDVLVIMLGFAGMPDQDGIIEAAGKAGVKYILPTEYGVDSGNDKEIEALPVIKAKRDVQVKIERLGMKYVSIITGLWLEYGLQFGIFNIQIPERKATLYTDSAPFVLTTIDQIAASIAALLGLPAATIDKVFANGYLYLSSFVLTQPELFSAVLQVTGTNEADWQVERKRTQDLIDEGREMINAGKNAGLFKILYGVQYQAGMGGDYSDLVHNEMLGLGTENLDEVVREAVDAAQPGGWAAADTVTAPK